MPRKKTGRNSFTKTALVLILSCACFLMPRHDARAQYSGNDDSADSTISPHDAKEAFGSRWREVLKSYKKADEQFYKKQEERLKDSQPLAFSKEQDAHKLIKAYPFLAQNLDFVLSNQKTVENYLRQHPGSNMDPVTHIYIAQNKDPKNEKNLFFLEERGTFACSAHGCPITIYVGHGKQYVTAMNYIGDDSINVARKDGQVSLFFDPQSQEPPVEWILRGDKFVQKPLPPTAAQAPAYLQWLRQKEKIKLQQNNPQQQAPEPQQSAPQSAAPEGPASSNDTFVP